MGISRVTPAKVLSCLGLVILYALTVRMSSFFHNASSDSAQSSTYSIGLQTAQLASMEETLKSFSPLTKENVKPPSEITTITQFTRLVQKDGLVVLTYASYGYRQNLINWIVSLNKVGVESFGVVCLDEEVDKFLAEKMIQCFSLWKYVEGGKEAFQGKRGSRLSLKNVRKLWTIRLKHLREILQDGLDVVFSDTDAVWLKNPLQEGTGLFSSHTGDIVASRGSYPWDVASLWGSTICMGVVYFHGTPDVIKIIEAAEVKAFEKQDDQIGMNSALNEFAMNQNKSNGRSYVFETRNVDTGEYKPAKLSFMNDRGKARATIKDSRIVLVPHQIIPRCCNVITDNEWESAVAVAHCHAADCKVAKTRKEHWGNFDSHTLAMRKYNLWSFADSGKTSWAYMKDLKGKAFQRWILEAFLDNVV